MGHKYSYIIQDVNNSGEMWYKTCVVFTLKIKMFDNNTRKQIRLEMHLRCMSMFNVEVNILKDNNNINNNIRKLDIWAKFIGSNKSKWE